MTKRPQRQVQPSPGKLVDAIAIIEKVRLSRETSLSLVGLGLTEVPESIGQLTQLRTLELIMNRLTKLPKFLSNLSQLQTLRLDANQITELPEHIGQLTQLRELYLGNNRLTRLPNSLRKLTQLQILALNSNKLTELPKTVCQLRQLRGLYVDDNNLTKLPESLLNLTRLERLYLHGNKALALPEEVLGDAWRQSPNAANPTEILEYYFRARGGQRRPLNEATLILVGRGAVGKTAIVNRLVHRMFTEEKKTEGIKITEWPMVVGRKKDEVRLNVWDFGGQEIMHATRTGGSRPSKS